MNTRSQAITAQNASIDRNVAAIEQSKTKPTAIQAMASRLGMSQGNLQETLLATVFKNASKAEFAALIVVANEYGLNPLTKEIYAFPQKGGGIVPLVSVDGWVRIMNQHPQFDGIEFTDFADDKGVIYAIEATIWRKDRSRPIKVTEYMDECKGNTMPWGKSPKRMLRHRALIQGARYAFGFSGIYADDDAEIQIIGEPVEARNVTPPPTRASMIAHDAETGEIIDHSEGRTDEQHGDQHDDGEVEEAPYAAMVAELLSRIANAETVIDARAVQGDWMKHAAALPDAENERIEAALNARLGELKGDAA